jgi:phosphinothricin acetyltransferase
LSSVTVRPLDVADAPAVRAIYAPYVETTPVSFEEDVPAAEEIVRRMLAGPRLPWLGAVVDGAVVGYAYASRHRARHAYRWSVEVSVYLVEDVQRRGIGRLLYDRLLTEVRALGYVSAYAGIALPNDPSVRLHESVGFAPIGVFPAVGFKLGAWRDVGWWHLPLREPPDSPHEPRPWTPDGI